MSYLCILLKKKYCIFLNFKFLENLKLNYAKLIIYINMTYLYNLFSLIYKKKFSSLFPENSFF